MGKPATELTYKAAPVFAFDGRYRTLSGFFPSISAAAKVVGVTPQAITACCSGTYVKVHNNYFRRIPADFLWGMDSYGVLTVEEFDRIVGLTGMSYGDSRLKNRPKGLTYKKKHEGEEGEAEKQAEKKTAKRRTRRKLTRIKPTEEL